VADEYKVRGNPTIQVNKIKANGSSRTQELAVKKSNVNKSV